MWSDLLASKKQTEVRVQHFYKLFKYDGRQEYEQNGNGKMAKWQLPASLF